MQLVELLNRIPVLESHGNSDREVSALVFDSRKVSKDSLYIAVKGTAADDIHLLHRLLRKAQKQLFAKIYRKI